MASLPVPVTTRQLTYIPLALMLVVVASGALLYFGALALALATGIPVHWNAVARGVLSTLPLAIFITLFSNWLVCGFAQPQFPYFYLFLPQVGLSQLATRLPHPVEHCWLPASLVLLVIGGLALWDAPRRMDAHDRAHFTRLPSFWKVDVRRREFGAPERGNLLSSLADLLLRAVLAALPVVTLAFVFGNTLLGLFARYGRPKPGEHALIYAVCAYLVLLPIVLAARAIFLGVQSGRLAPQYCPAQLVLKLMWCCGNLKLSKMWRGGNPVRRCATCGAFVPVWSECCSRNAGERTGNLDLADPSPVSVLRRALRIPLVMLVV